jgi:hypothetical protein
MMRYIPSIPSSLGDFIMKCCWIFSKDDQVVFVFASINVLYDIYRLAYVEPTLHPWDEANLVMVDDLLNVLLDLICHYFIEDYFIGVY